MAVHCEKCGARVSSRAALPGHYRRAHGRKRSLFPVLAKRLPSHAEHVQCKTLDMVPIRSEIARPGRESAWESSVQGETRIVSPPFALAPPKQFPQHILSLVLSDAECPPDWWEPQADPEWRVRQWNAFGSDYRKRLLAQRAGAAFTIRPPQAKDEVILFSQYHALKALATRPDAGVGAERERLSFEAGLREYNANYDRIVAERKALPRSSD